MTKKTLLALLIALLLTPTTWAGEVPLPPSFDEYIAREEPREPPRPADFAPREPLPLERVEVQHIAAPQNQNPELAEATKTAQRILAEPMNLGSMEVKLQNLPSEHQAAGQEIGQKLEQLDQIQSDLASGELDPVEIERAQTELQTLKKEVVTLRGKLKQESEDGEAASKVATGAAPAAESDEEVAMTELESIEDELAYREQIIERLLNALEEDGGSSDSALAASLLAAGEHPVTTSLLAFFAFATLWLLRGRIAEIAGFGIAVRFNGKANISHKRKGKNRK